jgi:hypothetical protein
VEADNTRYGRGPRRRGSVALMTNDPRLRDHADVAEDTARDLAEISRHVSSLIGEANAYLEDPNYSKLRLRLENAHAAVEAALVEARRRVRMNGEDERR